MIHHRIRKFQVTCNYNGWRIDQFLSQKIKRLTRSGAKSILNTVSVTTPDGLNRKIKGGTRLKTDDQVIVKEPLPLDEPDCPLWSEIKKLAAEGDLLALDKPPGLLVHPTAKVEKHTVVNYLDHQYHHLGRVEPVHRLDRYTSGVIIAAIGKSGIQKYRHLFSTDQVDKTYLAIVDDPKRVHTPQEAFTINTPLGFDSNSKVALKIGQGTWRAKTSGLTLSRYDNLALLKITIKTGRQHQIRAHMAMLGTPVYGDILYGAGDDAFLRTLPNKNSGLVSNGGNSIRHALHCSEISLPTAKGQTTFRAQLPHDMVKLITPSLTP